MTKRHSRTEVPYSAIEMFDLVADVERYPEFIPYCIGLRVINDNAKDGEGDLTADMLVAYKMFREKFRSHVTLNRSDGVIDVEYVDGPFKYLKNKWRFESREDGGSVINFDIDFEFKNIILQTAAKNVFERAFLKMSEAFVERAEIIYGKENQ